MKQHISRATSYAKNAALRAKTLMAGLGRDTSTLTSVEFVDGTYSKGTYLVIARRGDAKVSVRPCGGETWRVHVHPRTRAWMGLPAFLSYTAERNGHTSYTMNQSKLAALVDDLKSNVGAQVMSANRILDVLQIKADS